MKVRFAIILELFLPLLVAGSAVAAETVAVPLSSTAYTDLGVGPMALGATGGNIVYQISDAAPVVGTPGVVEPFNSSPAQISATAHVWAIAADVAAKNVAAIVATGAGVVSSPPVSGSATVGYAPALQAGDNTFTGANTFTGTVTANPTFAATGNGATTSAAAAARAGSVAIICVDFASPCDAQRVQEFGVNATSGSAIVTLPTAPTSAYVGANIVVAGLGNGLAQNVSSIVSPGSTNAVGDLLTLNVAACATKPVAKVMAISGPSNPWVVGATGAVVAAAIWVPGSCALAVGSLPSGTITVLSSTGSDTSATFTITWAAAPLPTTISGVNGSTITLASPSVQTVSGATEWAAWGHDDAPAINAALAAGVGAVLIPTNRTLGVYSGLSAPAATRLDLQCDSATIVALAPMSSMFTDPQNAGFFSSEGSTIERCRLDGMGVAQQNVNHQNFIWFFRDNVFRNATVGNLNVNGHGENSIFQSNQYENDLTIVGAYPQYNKSVNYTDNHFTDEIESGAVNNVYDNTAGSYYTNDHGYYATGPNFVLNGGFKADQLYADGIASNVPGIEVFGTYANIKGWTAYVSYGTGQIGAYIATQNGFNTINGGLAQGIANANVIAVGWGQSAEYGGNLATSNKIKDNIGAAYYSDGQGDGNVALGISAGSNGGGTAVGSFTFSAYASFAGGLGSNATVPGSAVLGYEAVDNGASEFSYASGANIGKGKQNWATVVLSQTTSGSSAVNLTVDGSAANASNCANLVAGQHEAIDVRMIVTDITTAKQYAAYWTAHLYTRSAAVSTVLIDGATTAVAPDSTRSNGTWTGASASIAADTTNGCLTVKFTPPTGNSDTLHAVATVSGPQVQ